MYYCGCGLCSLQSMQHIISLYGQDAFPARFKGIHVLNQPWYISIVMALVLPFLKQKYRERVSKLSIS